MSTISDLSHKGADLASESGKALVEIDKSSEQVTRSVSEIAAAMIEQSSGIE